MLFGPQYRGDHNTQGSNFIPNLEGKISYDKVHRWHYCKQTSQNSNGVFCDCSFWLGVTRFYMLWCRGTVAYCFFTFITLDWKETERMRQRERESKLWEWDPVWLRLFSFSFPLFLKVPPSPLLFFLASCTYCSHFVCVCMYVSLKSCTLIHSLSLELEHTHTHTHAHNEQICLHGCTMRHCWNVTTL